MKSLRIFNSPAFGIIDTSSWVWTNRGNDCVGWTDCRVHTPKDEEVCAVANILYDILTLATLGGMHCGFDHRVTRRWKVVRRQNDQNLLSGDHIEMPERTQTELNQQSTAYEPVQNPGTVGSEDLGTSSLLCSEQPRDLYAILIICEGRQNV